MGLISTISQVSISQQIILLHLSYSSKTEHDTWTTFGHQLGQPLRLSDAAADCQEDMTSEWIQSALHHCLTGTDSPVSAAVEAGSDLHSLARLCAPMQLSPEEAQTWFMACAGPGHI